MTRRKRVARNLVLLIFLTWLFMNRSGLYLSPMSAHKHSERSIHYGPSEVVHVEDISGTRLLLSRYDRWISCNTINRTLLFFWTFGSGVTGYEYDQNEPLDFTWAMSNRIFRLFGIVNNENIVNIEVTLDNGITLPQTKLHDGLFLVTWDATDDEGWYARLVRGYDADGNLVYEKKGY